MEADFESPLFLINGLVGIIFLLSVIVLHFFPPKKINPLYGYRTSRSMKNQKNWDLAQDYSRILMMRYGVYLIALSLVGLFAQIEDWLGIVISIFSIITLCAGLFIKTEQVLKDFESHEDNN